jgi:hypothetical protein
MLDEYYHVVKGGYAIERKGNSKTKNLSFSRLYHPVSIQYEYLIGPTSQSLCARRIKVKGIQLAE